MGRITVHSVHSHLCSLHFFLTLPAFTSEGETFTFFLVLGNFYKEEAFLQLSSVKFSPVIYTSSWEVTAREKQFSGHVYYVSMILGINWKNVRAAESLLLYFFLARIAYERFIGRNFLASRNGDGRPCWPLMSRLIAFKLFVTLKKWCWPHNSEENSPREPEDIYLKYKHTWMPTLNNFLDTKHFQN